MRLVKCPLRRLAPTPPPEEREGLDHEAATEGALPLPAPAPIRAELHLIPIAGPFFAPGEGQAAGGADLGGQVALLDHFRHRGSFDVRRRRRKRGLRYRFGGRRVIGC